MTLFLVENRLEAGNRCTGPSNNFRDDVDIDLGTLEHILVIDEFREPRAHLRTIVSAIPQQAQQRERYYVTSLFHDVWIRGPFKLEPVVGILDKSVLAGDFALVQGL